MLQILLAATAFSSAQAEPVKHRFIAVDESRSQLHYVDQFDSSKDWKIRLAGRFRDVQFVKNRVIVSTFNGYEEYDFHPGSTGRPERLQNPENPEDEGSAAFQTLEKVKSVADAAYNRTETVIRLPNGHTLLGCNVPGNQGGGVRFFELDETDRPVRDVTFPKLHHLRLARLARNGSLLFGCDNRVIIGQWDGTAKEFITKEEKRHIYEVEELAGGNLRVSTGYGAVLEEWTPDGKFVRTLCGGTAPEGFFYLFFGRAQQLANRNWVVSNWTGHDKEDSRKGAQLIEFDETGKIIWSWHDPERAGSVHGAIIIE
jgi:hypothetical protein